MYKNSYERRCVERDKNILEQHKQGKRLTHIAKEFGISPTRISEIIKRNIRETESPEHKMRALLGNKIFNNLKKCGFNPNNKEDFLKITTEELFRYKGFGAVAVEVIKDVQIDLECER